MPKSPRPNARQRSIRAAIKKLGADRVEAFLRAARAGGPSCMAVRLINEELDAGARVEDALLDGDMYGYYLRVRPPARGRFQIEFGCVAGPMVGDGGTWTVEFDDAGAVVSAEQGAMTIY